MGDPHCLRRTVNKSFWSFLNSFDACQQAFQANVEDEYGFVDAFTDLLFDINACPPGTPITVEWNSNRPRYDSTCDTQVFKAFTDLPKDLPFVYGSLTIRLWLPDCFTHIIPAMARSKKHGNLPCSWNGIFRYYRRVQK
jgi:hypothetical protein